MRIPQYAAGALPVRQRGIWVRLRAGQNHAVSARYPSERAGGIGALAADTAEDAATDQDRSRAAGRRVRLVDRAFRQPLGPPYRRRGLVAPAALGAAAAARAFPLLYLPEILGGYALPGLALAFAAAQCDFGIVGPVAALLALMGRRRSLAGLARRMAVLAAHDRRAARCATCCCRSCGSPPAPAAASCGAVRRCQRARSATCAPLPGSAAASCCRGGWDYETAAAKR